MPIQVITGIPYYGEKYYAHPANLFDLLCSYAHVHIFFQGLLVNILDYKKLSVSFIFYISNLSSSGKINRGYFACGSLRNLVSPFSIFSSKFAVGNFLLIAWRPYIYQQLYPPLAALRRGRLRNLIPV